MEELPSVPPSPSSTKPFKRKGKMAKHRDAEKFRLNHNQRFDSEMVEKFSSLRILPTAVSAMFADLVYTPSVRPPTSYLITLTVLPQLVRLVCSHLVEACKVSLDTNEVITILFVTLAQIQARVFTARLSTPYPPDFSLESQVSKVKRLLQQNIFPISHYVHCIGKVKLDNQLHIPVTDFSEDSMIHYLSALGYQCATDVSRVISLPDGNPYFGSAMWINFRDDDSILWARSEGILQPDGLAFTPAFSQTMQLERLAGRIMLTPPLSRVPTLDSAVATYHRILAKIQRRVPQCLDDISFDVDGHPSVLVEHRIVHAPSQHVQAWCDRFIPDEALVVGAVLQFCENEDGPPDRVCVVASVENSGAIERYARIVVERAMAK